MLSAIMDNNAKAWTYPITMALFTQAASGAGIVPDDNPSTGAAGTDPQEIDTGSGYARQTVTFGTATAASPSVLASSNAQSFPPATGNWSSTNGNTWIGAWVLYNSDATPLPTWVGAFNQAKQVQNLDTVTVASGDLQLQLD